MDQIDHFLHRHPLMLTKKEEVNDKIVCSGCNQVLAAPIYGCSDCKFYLHKSCAELQREMQNFFHPYPLVLDIEPYSYTCNGCFQHGSGFTYRCGHCDFYMHVKCALRPTIESEGEELIHHFTHWHPLTLVDQEKGLEVQCRICEKLCSGSCDFSAYGCEQCSFFLHNSCMNNIPREINHLFHPSCPLILLTTPSGSDRCASCEEDGSGLVFRCGKCEFQLDVKCALLPTVESKGADKIQHSAHQHPLALREFCSEVGCKACGENWLGPCFACEKCDFFIHKQCAVELQQEIRHHFHPRHPLILSSLPPGPNYDTFKCLGCGGSDDRFLLVYRCAKCDFILHTACAKAKQLTPFLLKYEGHQHSLIFFDKTRGPFPCRICRQDAQNCFFRCVACRFNIHLYCFPSAPKTIKHKCHSHPLTLTSSPFEFELNTTEDKDNSDDEFYCDVCEEKRCKFESVYYCEECRFIAEIRCVISELLPSLTISEESTMNGRVISRYEEISALEATIAKLSNEVAELRAKEESLEDEIEELEDTLTTIKWNREQLEIDYNLHIYQLNRLKENNHPTKASISERLAPHLS